jgi:hypothetical protein
VRPSRGASSSSTAVSRAATAVGRPLPHGGDLVTAILDHGRDEPYAVHTRDGAQQLTRVARPVYDVTDFS